MISASVLPLVDLHETVAEALDKGRPVVALESTIITHGMPFPDNERMSEAVEKTIVDAGAVPALIAVIDGRIKVGLAVAERFHLAALKDVRKLSRADLAYAVSEGLSGGTTVAATMIVAGAVGIKVFATGGIGGVHRGAEKNFDISADLAELSKTNVIVVAAGPKAILDIPKTLEVLETLGVPVVAFQTDVMPAFWSRTSANAAPIRLDSAAAIARLQTVREQLGLAGGMLVANPIPAEDEIPAELIEQHVAEAQAAAELAGIGGKALTPFLLERILARTKGESLRSNIALVKNNAQLAAQIAVALQTRG